MLQDLLNKAGIDVDIEEVLEGKKFQVHCPLALWTHEKGSDSHPSSRIATNDDGEVYFHCFTCKTSGSLSDLLFDYADYMDDAELKKATLKSFPELKNPQIIKLSKIKRALFRKENIPEEMKDHSEDFHKLSSMIKSSSGVADYLRERNVPSKIARSYNLCYDRKGTRLLFPVYSDGKLVTTVGRALLSDQLPKYYNYYTALTGTVLGGLHLFNPQIHTRIILVEGFFDLLNIAGFDKASLPVCCFGARLTQEQAKILERLYYSKIIHRPQICLMYDGDKPGRQATAQAAKRLQIPNRSKEVIWLPDGRDPGSITKDEFNYFIKEKKQWRPAKARKKIVNLKDIRGALRG